VPETKSSPNIHIRIGRDRLIQKDQCMLKYKFSLKTGPEKLNTLIYVIISHSQWAI